MIQDTWDVSGGRRRKSWCANPRVLRWLSVARSRAWDALLVFSQLSAERLEASRRRAPTGSAQRQQHTADREAGESGSNGDRAPLRSDAAGLRCCTSGDWKRAGD